MAAYDLNNSPDVKWAVVAWQVFISFSSLTPDLDAPESDPLPGDRSAVPGGRADPGQGRPGPAAAGGEPAGAEPGCWQDPTGDHHQVPEGNTG